MSNPTSTNIAPLPITETQPLTHLVFINDLELDMSIGVYEHEKLQTQPVRINIEIIAEDHQGPVNDDYHNVVCYESIANQIKELVKDEHINLVETLAENVAEICLSPQRAIKATVRIEKLRAIKEAGSVGVQITRGKP
jgi:7,8-dihydroneopterin aldolase/epimerase/oxygenase